LIEPGALAVGGESLTDIGWDMGSPIKQVRGATWAPKDAVDFVREEGIREKNTERRETERRRRGADGGKDTAKSLEKEKSLKQ